MSEITILLYLTAAAAFGASRLQRFSARSRPFYLTAFLVAAIGIATHAGDLAERVFSGPGVDLAIGHVASMLGLELALIATLAAINAALRGISAALLMLAAVAAGFVFAGEPAPAAVPDWQTRAHILIALLSYGVLSVGAIVAVFALLQDRRLRSGRVAAPANALFAPLETTERLLFVITTAGFAGLAIAITLGLTFVNDLFAQHLVHKTTLALLALVVFGVLLAGRLRAGWRGARAVRLYLAGFALLCLAYFGSRIVLEQVLGRSWA